MFRKSDNITVRLNWTTSRNHITTDEEMCNDCFGTEIKLFKDKSTWTSFDFELTKKIQQGKIKHIKFIPDRFRDKDDGEDIYECLTCGQRWKLRDPWHFGDGYFLKLSTIEKITTRLTEKQKLIFGLVIFPLLIIINVIYWLWTH